MVSYTLDHKIFHLGNVPIMKSDSLFEQMARAGLVQLKPIGRPPRLAEPEQMSLCGNVPIMKSDFILEQMSPIRVHDEYLTLKLKYTHW